MLQKVETYCREQLAAISKEAFAFHNLGHTEAVVKAAGKLAGAANLSLEDRELLLVAAWFHDLGYLEKIVGHEAVSQQMAKEYLEGQNYPKKRIEAVLDIISATVMPQQPKTELGKFLADADLAGLGSKDFFLTSQNLRNENAIQGQRTYANDLEWLAKERDFLAQHKYFTDAAQMLFQGRKIKHLMTIKDKIQIMGDKKDDVKFLHFPEEGKSEKKAAKKEKSDPKAKEKEGPKFVKRGRGVESLFRVSLRNHISLSAIADRKANILLSTNAIIISVAVSLFMPSLQQNKELVFPMTILMITNMLTIIYTILATRPNVTDGQTTRKQIEDRKSNLTFFGNFYKMDLDEYLWGMNEMVNDEEFIYKSFSRDLYFLGKVLAKKYAMLRKAYTIFMVGLILTTIAFLVSVAIYPMFGS